MTLHSPSSVEMSKVSFVEPANIDTICGMGSALDGDGSIHMGIDNRERTNVFGVKLFCCFAWLVIVVMVFPVCTSKVVINYILSTFL
jgi:hypothetical protein